MSHQTSGYEFKDKDADYARLAAELKGLLEGETDRVANAANAASLLFHALPDVNWVGFYFMRTGELVVGPFQGKPACVRIALGKGVCGTAAARRETIVVPNVEAFPGHIACDSASRSEIVVPLVRDGAMIGVLDIDSPIVERFDDADRRGIERAAAIFMDSIRSESAA